MNAKTILKEYQKFHNFPFHIERFSPESPIQLHYHDCVELIFCTGGFGLNHVEETCLKLKKGDLFVIGGMQTHTMSDFKNFEGYRILFDLSLLDDLDDEIKSTTGYTSLFLFSENGYINYNFKSCINIRENYFNRLVPLMKDLLYEYENEKIFNEKYIRLLFSSICTLIIKCYESVQDESSKALYNEAVSFLFKNLDEETSIREIVKAFGISERYFRKIFTEHTGLSPSHFIIELRLRRAKSLLSCSNKSITEIAFSCGFYDSCHLNRIFKKYEGITPKEYRKRTRK